MTITAHFFATNEHAAALYGSAFNVVLAANGIDLKIIRKDAVEPKELSAQEASLWGQSLARLTARAGHEHYTTTVPQALALILNHEVFGGQHQTTALDHFLTIARRNIGSTGEEKVQEIVDAVSARLPGQIDATQLLDDKHHGKLISKIAASLQ